MEHDLSGPGEQFYVPAGNIMFFATPKRGVFGARPRYPEMPVEVMAADGAFDPDAWLVEYKRAMNRCVAVVPRPPKGWRLVYDYSVTEYYQHSYGPKVLGLERGDEPTSYFREEGGA